MEGESFSALAFAWWETDKSWHCGWMLEVMDGSKLLLWKPNFHPEHICGPANKDEHVHLHFREHFLLSSVFPVCWSQSQCHVSEELQGFHFALVSISPSAEGASFQVPFYFFCSVVFSSGHALRAVIAKWRAVLNSADVLQVLSCCFQFSCPCCLPSLPEPLPGVSRLQDILSVMHSLLWWPSSW